MPAPSTKRSPRRAASATRPLDELRTALGAFAREHVRGDDAGAARVLHEARRLARSLGDLIDYERAPEPRPVRCTAREIMLAARLALPKAWRARLLIVRDADAAVLHTDGALVARALSRLLRNAFEAGSECVLLGSSAQAGYVSFHALDRAPGHGLELDSAPEPFASARDGHAGLGLALAWREVGALDGDLRLSRLQGGGTRALLRVRRVRAEEDAR